jgi:hypothetical protein
MWRGIFKVYPEVGAVEQAMVEDKGVNLVSFEVSRTLRDYPKRWAWYVRFYLYDGPGETTSLIEEFHGETDVGATKPEAIVLAQEVKTREIEKWRLTDEEQTEFKAEQHRRTRPAGGMSVGEAIAAGDAQT